MLIRALCALIGGLLVGCSIDVTLADSGDAAKAKSMLEQVVVAVKKDQAAAMKMFTAGSDGFKDGDIYPFCFDLKDGTVMSGQTVGRDIRTFANGGGQLMFDAAQKPEGVVSEAAYLARKPAPANDMPVKKVSVVTRVGQIGCGVGYYP